MKVVMSILVKDEIDIIERNIKIHSHLGVDAFVVMDNNSSDGTREKLEELKSSYEITIIDEKGLYQQALWMRKLAMIARKIYNPLWIISNDADEFWIPRGFNSIKEVLNQKLGAVLTCNRYNMILDNNCKYDYFNSKYRVDSPIFYNKYKEINQENVSIMLTKIAPKVIFKARGLLLIRGGNHKALHVRNMLDYFRSYDKIKKFDGIDVLHYPVRSYEQFRKNILNRYRLLEDTKHVSMGPHYRRWAKLYNENKLEEEFNKRIIFNEESINTLSKYGILKEETSMIEINNKVL